MPVEVNDEISLHSGRTKHKLVRGKVVCVLKLRAKSCYVSIFLTFEVVLGFTDVLLLYLLSMLTSLSINQPQIIQLETIH